MIKGHNHNQVQFMQLFYYMTYYPSWINFIIIVIMQYTQLVYQNTFYTFYQTNIPNFYHINLYMHLHCTATAIHLLLFFSYLLLSQLIYWLYIASRFLRIYIIIRHIISLICSIEMYAVFHNKGM